jgi:DNA-binding NarL/FixJ family response regulator
LGEILNRPRILIADDHTLIAEAFTLILEPEFEVVGTVGDGRALLDVADALKPDLVLLDIYMPFMDGLEAGQKLKSAHPRIKIILLTVSDDAKTAAHCLNKWASGYLLKKSMGPELLIAVRDVLRGRNYITPILQNEILEATLSGRSAGSPRVLTSREREVLRLLARGCTMKEAAAVLHLATRTVAFHKYRIMRNLGVKTNSDLLRFAITQNFVDRI